MAGYYDLLERAEFTGPGYANFNGMVGEFLRRVYHPKRFYKNIGEMIMDDAYTHFVGIGDTLKLLDIERNEMSEHVQNLIKDFPETENDALAQHLFFDFCNKSVFAGENRHRLFNWVAAPFWGLELFEYIVEKIPVGMIGYSFYLDFLKAIDKRLINIPFYGNPHNMNNTISRNMFLVKDAILRFARDNRYLYKLVKKVKRQPAFARIDAESKSLIEKTLTLCRDSEITTGLFNISHLELFLLNRANRLQFYQLLTIILYIHELEKRFYGKISIDAT
jgi:hypothetical protein